MLYKATINIDRKLWDKFKTMCREEYGKTASEFLREMIEEELANKRKWEIDDHHYLEADISQNSYRIRLIQDRMAELEKLIKDQSIHSLSEGTDLETDNKTEIETDSKTEVETEVETEIETKIETDSKTEVETDSKTEVETDSKTKIETDSKTEVETDSKTEVETDLLLKEEKTDWARIETKVKPEDYGSIRRTGEMILQEQKEIESIESEKQVEQILTTLKDIEVAEIEGITRSAVYNYRKKNRKPSVAGFFDRWQVSADGKGWHSKEEKPE